MEASGTLRKRGIALVTGASSGIGEATALHLHSLGFEVLAGVRKNADGERLRKAGPEPVRLDVTDLDSIDAAREQLGDRPLAGLVNNAGVAVSGPLEYLPIEELRRQLEINLIGQVAVTQAFIPALRAGGGRIVNMSSIGGRIALPLMSVSRRRSGQRGTRLRTTCSRICHPRPRSATDR